MLCQAYLPINRKLKLMIRVNTMLNNKKVTTGEIENGLN